MEHSDEVAGHRGRFATQDSSCIGSWMEGWNKASLVSPAPIITGSGAYRSRTTRALHRRIMPQADAGFEFCQAARAQNGTAPLLIRRPIAEEPTHNNQLGYWHFALYNIEHSNDGLAGRHPQALKERTIIDLASGRQRL